MHGAGEPQVLHELLTGASADVVQDTRAAIAQLQSKAVASLANLAPVRCCSAHALCTVVRCAVAYSFKAHSRETASVKRPPELIVALPVQFTKFCAADAVVCKALAGHVAGAPILQPHLETSWDSCTVRTILGLGRMIAS